MIVAKPKKRHVSPRSMNAMLVGITRSNPDMQRISGSNESVHRVLSSDELDAQMSFDRSLNANLFGEQDVQKALESRDKMDQQGDAQEYQYAEDPPPKLEPYSDDSASDNDGDEYAAVESEDEIVDETIRPSPTKMRTRSKTRQPVLPDPVLCSDTEDDESRPRQRKRNHTIATPLRAGATSKYFRRNSNQFPSIASKTLAARKARAGSRGRK